MAGLRTGTRLLRQANCIRSAVRTPGTRAYSSKQAGAAFATARPLVVGGVALGAAYTAYKTYFRSEEGIPVLPVAYAASTPACQPSVVSQTKEHALYLWIHLKPNADAKACAKSVAKLQALVDAVCPPDLRDESDEIWAGVGFGPQFYSKLGGKAKQDYSHITRKGEHGAMPSGGGDIFIHAKSDNTSKLFELCQTVLAAFPKDSVDKFEDIYSFVYKNGRDLSGFIDGTENPADDDDRHKNAVEPASGGSYVITQKWIHDLKLIAEAKASTMESWLGRTREDSIELDKKLVSSHVARMTGGTAMANPKKHEIVRQSMPYGTVSDKAGLFFIAYSSSPEKFNYMLDRMTAREDKHSDDVMRLSTCVASTYWYFPGEAELKKFQ